jgi:hypothetical protein
MPIIQHLGGIGRRILSSGQPGLHSKTLSQKTGERVRDRDREREREREREKKRKYLFCTCSFVHFGHLPRLINQAIKVKNYNLIFGFSFFSPPRLFG